ncbi:hypothetical protein LXL04_001331 [Taraxacum kok-saghyz]
MATGQPCFSYDVFLSFRGEDTRHTFTDHLYTALIQAGIRTFRDDDAVERGKRLKPELDKAIHESAISLIVFSKNYASSKWCLNEVLASIEEHETSSFKHEVIPVSYKVEPSDVRHQTESFKDVFDGYDNEIEAETNLEKKRELSKKVGDRILDFEDCIVQIEWHVYSYHHMVPSVRYEAKFVTEIVNVIRKKLDYKALYIEEKLVGMKDNVTEIESWLQDPSPNAVILLIDGIGCIGKTTIATCIYNSNSGNYNRCCFLVNINEASNQPGGMIRLQSHLLSTNVKSGKEETIWNVHEGTLKVTNAISNKQVLLILDDVSSSEQLNALLGPKRFYHGSKVIITTRNKELSTAFTTHHKVHSVGTLSRYDATNLFSLHAFDQDQPIEPYILLSGEIINHCKGLPLALKVLGSSLRGMTVDEWKDTMHQLAANPDPEIQEVLEISYKSLKHDNDKEIFLHIACFFDGEEKYYIVKLLAQCDLYPVVGIKNLMNRCLQYVDQSGRVMLHQLIKEMGREVVRKESPKDPGKRSRLWHHQECVDVLQDLSGTKKVEGLMIDMQKTDEAESTSAITINNPRERSLEEYLGKRTHGNDADFKIGALEKMKNLMLLQLNYVTFSRKCKKLPRRLRLLRWHGCTLKAIPSESRLEKLVVLDMSHSKLKRVWDDFKMSGCGVIGRGQILESVPSFSLLKKLNLSYCNLFDNSFPNDWSSLVSLDNLILDGNNISSLPKCIQTLPRIETLTVKGCSKLKLVLGPPESLRYLYGLGNTSLEKVQLAQNQVYAEFDMWCPKLCEMEGRFKIRSIDKVERTIIQYLGLQLNVGEGTMLDDLGLKV